MNGGKIRQSGSVVDGYVSVTLIKENSDHQLQKTTQSHTLTHSIDRDKEMGSRLLNALREDLAGLPIDPFATLPFCLQTSQWIQQGSLLDIKDVPQALLIPAKKLDLVGLYSSGKLIRGNANSVGAFHWFETDSFLFDFSLYGPRERAYKGYFGGSNWHQEEWEAEIKKGRSQLEALSCPVRSLPTGEYKTYLAPAAVWEILGLMENSFSEQSLQKGDSPIRSLRWEKRKLSHRLSLKEDFSFGDVPRFNGEGELAQKTINLIVKGQLNSTLINQRTAKEYQLKANGASLSESMNSPWLEPGSLRESDILKKLERGLYISNLHYLNWSDRNQGRITGMTRYACFWVEDGKLKAPIKNLRWDDTIFRILGSELEDLTDKCSTFPSTFSYGGRSVGVCRCPGILLRSMNFTL